MIDKLIKKFLNKEFILQVFKFGVVGVIVSVLDWCVVAVCVRLLHIDSMVGNILSYALVTPFNFWASGKFVFDFGTGENRKKQYVQFFLLGAVGFLINEVVMFFGDKMMHFDPLWVKVVGIILAAIFNFISRKLLLEKKAPKETEQ